MSTVEEIREAASLLGNEELEQLLEELTDIVEAREQLARIQKGEPVADWNDLRNELDELHR